jgi:hypothetical protein
MVIDDFNVRRTVVGPAEADAVLIVDPDGVLAVKVTTQTFETVSRGERADLRATSPR